MASSVPEIKAAGVEEAARDPNSKVTSEDAKKVIAEESKKAGIPAFRFDPSASTEEKKAAAAATAVSDTYAENLFGLTRIVVSTSWTRRKKEAPCCWHCDRHCKSKSFLGEH